MKNRSQLLIICCLILLILIGVFLRSYKITSIPPALHPDESGTTYNAYLLLSTGYDEYGKWFPFTFRNDFSPLIFYATIPFVAIFGLTELSTRLPTLLISIAFLLAFFRFTQILFCNRKLTVLVTLLITLSSWHIRMSRLGLEMMWALFFQTVASCFLLYAINVKTRQRFYTISAFLIFSLSIISYQSAKMTTPLLILSIYTIYAKRFFKKNIILSLSLFFIFIIIPIGTYFVIRPFHEMRFVGISVFTVWKNAYRSGTNLFTLQPLTALFQTILSNYIVHFDPQLLFFNNDRLRYFQLSELGMLYPWQFFFLITGIVYLFRNIKSRPFQFLLTWILIAPFPAALTTGVPYANVGRALMLFPGLELITALGIIWITALLRKKHFLFLLLFCTGLIFIEGMYVHTFLFQYFNIMPKKYATFWGEPLKKVLPYVLAYESTVDKIIITNVNNQAYMYFLFYAQKSPTWFLSQSKQLSKIVGYSTIGKYEFRKINWPQDSHLKNTLLVGTTEEIPSATKSFIIETPDRLTSTPMLRILKL